jgi:hypothetical protein
VSSGAQCTLPLLALGLLVVVMAVFYQQRCGWIWISPYQLQAEESVLAMSVGVACGLS